MITDFSGPDGGQGGRPLLLFVVNVSWFFISHRLALARAALAHGFDVHLATLVDSAGDADKIQAAGIVLHPVEIGRGNTGLIHDLRTLWQLYRLYGRLKPDIVQHVAMKPLIYGGIAARLRGIAVVQAVPGLGYLFSGDGFRRGIIRTGAVWALRIACGGGRVRGIVQNIENFHTLVDAKILRAELISLVRGSGVSVAAINVRDEPVGTIRIVLAARMLREKGIEDFVAAARKFQARGVSAEFILAGEPDDGNPGSLTRSQLQRWTAEGVVKWLGYVDDIPDLYADSHIICLPSYYGEGVPKALIEAAACARPIVTTDQPGCRDIVRNGENGILVPPRDVEALCSALLRLVQDPGLRHKFGYVGREIAAADFDLHVVNTQILGIYDLMLDDGS